MARWGASPWATFQPTRHTVLRPVELFWAVLCVVSLLVLAVSVGVML
jgi:quinol-cytochrome oxidoreductase complex cytochrome b subunit